MGRTFMSEWHALRVDLNPVSYTKGIRVVNSIFPFKAQTVRIRKYIFTFYNPVYFYNLGCFHLLTHFKGLLKSFLSFWVLLYLGEGIVCFKETSIFAAVFAFFFFQDSTFDFPFFWSMCIPLVVSQLLGLKRKYYTSPSNLHQAWFFFPELQTFSPTVYSTSILRSWKDIWNIL